MNSIIRAFKQRIPRTQMDALTSLLQYCKQVGCERYVEFLIGMVSSRQLTHQGQRDLLLRNLYEKYLSVRAKPDNLIDLPFDLLKKVRKNMERDNVINYDNLDDVFQFVVDEIETTYLANNPDLYNLLSRTASI
jgi:hypothetical protein